MKKLFLSLFSAFLFLACASTQVQEIQESKCDRMLWRPDLNEVIQMFCLGKEFCGKEKPTQCTKLIAEAYHPTDQGILYTLWDNDNDCVADTNFVYFGKRGNDGKYTYAFSHMQPALIGLEEIRNSEEKHGIKVLREIECLKKE